MTLLYAIKIKTEVEYSNVIHYVIQTNSNNNNINNLKFLKYNIIITIFLNNTIIEKHEQVDATFVHKCE